MDMTILHSRPNPIIAALYTLRDLDVDLILLHGPAGCGFRASRLLEMDGVRVLTTAMTEKDLIFGAKEKLIKTIKRAYEKFHPKTIGIVGTCASMIIGENLASAYTEASIPSIPLIIDVHGCKGDNTQGAILVLEAAHQQGLISKDELERQTAMLQHASRIEKERGLAGFEYISPEKGDNLDEIANFIIETLYSNELIYVVLNAKKETVYLFADILLAIKEAQRKLSGKVIILANLNETVGLPRIRRYARDILTELDHQNIKIDHIIGGLDEYPKAGELASAILKNESSAALKILIGIPQAIQLDSYSTTIAITNGPREVFPLRQLGCKLVGVELYSHSAVMGTRTVVQSELGKCIRTLLKEM
ncbi:MAG: Ni-sirohydrochlorin a,c-diamide reductive cyclase catalytic subunit [Candidatus Helarchaeota archaeon]